MTSDQIGPTEVWLKFGQKMYQVKILKLEPNSKIFGLGWVIMPGWVMNTPR